MENSIWIKSKTGKPYSASVRLTKKRFAKDPKFFDASISKDMAEKGIPIPVPVETGDFFATNAKKLVEVVPDGDKAEKLYNDYCAKRDKEVEDSMLEKSRVAKAGREVAEAVQDAIIGKVKGKRIKEATE